MAGQKREARLRADVPAIHAFFAAKPQGRGCPAAGYAQASPGLMPVRRSFSEGGHKAGQDEDA
jgi:hypothetical protein